MSTEWQFLVALNERLRPLRDPVEIQDVAVRLLGEHLHANRVHYSQIDGDEFVLCRSFVDGVAPFPHRGPLELFGRAADAFRRGEFVVVNDVEHDERINGDGRERLRRAEVGAFAAAPLLKEGRWVATLSVHSAATRVWTSEQVVAIELTADRMWSAVERARAEDALGRSLDRQSFLQMLNETIRPLGDPDRILAETCRLLGTHFRVNRVVYTAIDGEECTVVNDFVDGVPSLAGRFRWVDLAGSRFREILNGGSLIVENTATDPRTAAERDALRSAGIGAYLCPLLLKDGQWLGAFGIHNREPRVWTADEISLAQEVADRVWATLEHRKAEAGLRANEERLAFLLRLNDAIRPLSEPGDVKETAARLLGEHLGVTRVGYAEFEDGKFVIRREYTNGVPSFEGQPSPIALGPTFREALLRGETIVVDDVGTDPRFTDEERVRARGNQVAALVGATRFKDGRIVAAFGANNSRPRAWSPAEIEMIRAVAERTWDAVERTRAEAELHQRKTRYRLALEASMGGSWTWDAVTNVVDWDQRFRALYGFGPDHPATTDAWMPRVHEDDRNQVMALLNEITTSKTMDSWENTFRVVLPDGTMRWIQSRGRADRDAAGAVTRLTGLDLDFTHHHRIEEALQTRRDEEHDRALLALLETATQGIVSVDAKGTILTANKAVEQMFGWRHGELIGESIECLIPEALHAAHARHRAEYFDAPHPRLMGGGLHLVGRRRDGTTFPIEVSLNFVGTPGGGQAFAFVTDITERQRAAASLYDRTVELERRTTQLSRMASDLTLAEQRAREQIARTLHDGLQQLLVIVSMNLEQQAKREAEAGGASSNLLAHAQRHLDEAIAAARSLNFELFPPVLQHSGLPTALVWLAKWTRDKYKVEVDATVDRRADTARKDVRTLLFESVRELLFNAVKHARADRIALELALDADDQLCITVADRGIGFNPAAVDDQSGPVGWGLFSIRERLTLLGGRFDIDSAPGQGARFRLVAPRGTAPIATESVLSLAPIGTVLHEEPVRNPDALRILVVDDHAAVRGALRQILHEHLQFSVVGEAANGFEAIAHAHSIRPDVILIDVSMPHMDGIESTRRIHGVLPDIEILALSMEARPGDVSAIEEAGASGFFVKGVDTARLIEHLLVLQASRVSARTAGSD